jgi:hypothetical protein
MKMSELMLAIGDDNIEFQNLDRDAHSLNWNAKTGTKITFNTGIGLSPSGLDKLGLVIWLPRDAVKAAIGGETT